jgi:hypothetical protein
MILRGLRSQPVHLVVQQHRNTTVNAQKSAIASTAMALF